MPDNDQNKESIPDDKTIADDTLLYRRVMNQPDPPVKQIVWDDNKNCWRPSSVAFTDHKNGSPMSVALGDTLKKEGLEPDSVLIGHENFSLVCFPAEVPRSKQLGIVRSPIEEDLANGVEADSAHGEVVGKKTKGVKNALKNSAEWYKEPNLPKP